MDELDELEAFCDQEVAEITRIRQSSRGFTMYETGEFAEIMSFRGKIEELRKKREQK